MPPGMENNPPTCTRSRAQSKLFGSVRVTRVNERTLAMASGNEDARDAMFEELILDVQQEVDDLADFSRWTQFTVYTEHCNSWYKTPDGTVIGLWPGSALHAIRTLANPRWEDYEYESIDKTRNRLHWLGAGNTKNEQTTTGDLAWYLDAPDVPPIPE
ncbi:hypothetical protein GGX14DRAFT_553640 [Mycena pura]|uniref:Uncharacterized protein n=1 Tax=Mycena pura TaxID=153505 RepID=A0AAD6YUQ6_9AGAR|nr:hypothetical protein GGX14DRAFT_553640 [Mycena pura]